VLGTMQLVSDPFHWTEGPAVTLSPGTQVAVMPYQPGPLSLSQSQTLELRLGGHHSNMQWRRRMGCRDTRYTVKQ